MLPTTTVDDEKSTVIEIQPINNNDSVSTISDTPPLNKSENDKQTDVHSNESSSAFSFNPSASPSPVTLSDSDQAYKSPVPLSLSISRTALSAQNETFPTALRRSASASSGKLLRSIDSPSPSQKHVSIRIHEDIETPLPSLIAAPDNAKQSSVEETEVVRWREFGRRVLESPSILASTVAELDEKIAESKNNRSSKESSLAESSTNRNVSDEKSDEDDDDGDFDHEEAPQSPVEPISEHTTKLYTEPAFQFLISPLPAKLIQPFLSCLFSLPLGNSTTNSTQNNTSHHLLLDLTLLPTSIHRPFLNNLAVSLSLLVGLHSHVFECTPSTTPTDFTTEPSNSALPSTTNSGSSSIHSTHNGHKPLSVSIEEEKDARKQSSPYYFTFSPPKLQSQDSLEPQKEKYLSPPIFTNLFVVQNINRASATSQAALIQAMRLKQVTRTGQILNLSPIHLVIGAFSMQEQESEVSTNSSQVWTSAENTTVNSSLGLNSNINMHLLSPKLADEFMYNIMIDVNDVRAVEEFLRTLRMKIPDLQTISGQPLSSSLSMVPTAAALHTSTTSTTFHITAPTTALFDWYEMRTIASNVFLASTLQQYIRDLIITTRQHCRYAFGPSPHGTAALMRASQHEAFFRGFLYVRPIDIDVMAENVLSHRITVRHSGGMLNEPMYIRAYTVRALLHQLVNNVLTPPK